MVKRGWPVFRCWRWPSCVTHHQQRRAVRRIDHMSFHEACFLVGAHGTKVLRIGIGDHARQSGGEPRVGEGADQSRTMSALDHAGFTNEEIDATRALRMGAKT